MQGRINSRSYEWMNEPPWADSESASAPEGWYPAPSSVWPAPPGAPQQRTPASSSIRNSKMITIVNYVYK